MAGAAWWVGRAGRAMTRGAVGHAALEPEREPLTVEHAFDLASLTKPLCTGLLLALLEQDGAIDPERPVGQLLPQLRGSRHAEASLLSLASHTAGLPAWSPLYLGASTLDGFLRRIASMPPVRVSGRTLYSDLGYILLGAALERATGRSLDRLFREIVAEPLGLGRTGFAAGDYAFDRAAATERGNEYERKLAGAEAEGHAWPDELLRGRVHDRNARTLGGVAGHAGLFGTAAEVAALAGEILKPHRLGLGPKARGRLLSPAPGSRGRTAGFELASEASAARGVLPADAPGHTGFTGTSLWLVPQTGDVYVLLANRVHPAVPPVGFHPVRRGFHRLGAALLRAG